MPEPWPKSWGWASRTASAPISTATRICPDRSWTWGRAAASSGSDHRSKLGHGEGSNTLRPASRDMGTGNDKSLSRGHASNERRCLVMVVQGRCLVMLVQEGGQAPPLGGRAAVGRIPPGQRLYEGS